MKKAPPMRGFFLPGGLPHRNFLGKKLEYSGQKSKYHRKTDSG
jgi:hypothetical protein